MIKKFSLRRLGVAHDVGGSKPTLQSCLEAVLDHSDALVDDILGGLQASLSPVKSKTLFGYQNPASQPAIEALCAQAEGVKKTFSAALRSAVYGGELQLKTVKPMVRYDDFQFLEEEQIDANIELAMTEQEVLQSVGDVLPTLDAFISSLLGWVTVQAHLNPLRPESFVW